MAPFGGVLCDFSVTRCPLCRDPIKTRGAKKRLNPLVYWSQSVVDLALTYCFAYRKMPSMLTALWKKPEIVSEDAPEPDISLLGRALRFRGTLDTLGDVHIFGRVVGRINAGRVVLGIGGYVEGDVVAREVLLCGRFEGRIFAFNVAIAPSAVLKGRVFHHTITVAKEAQIEGRMPWRPINFFETLEELPKET